MITRRRFLGTLVRSAAGLLVADDALELLVEPRRFWPGADFSSPLTAQKYVLHIDGEGDEAYFRDYVNRFAYPPIRMGTLTGITMKGPVVEYVYPQPIKVS